MADEINVETARCLLAIMPAFVLAQGESLHPRNQAEEDELRTSRECVGRIMATHVAWRGATREAVESAADVLSLTIRSPENRASFLAAASAVIRQEFGRDPNEVHFARTPDGDGEEREDSRLWNRLREAYLTATGADPRVAGRFAGTASYVAYRLGGLSHATISKVAAALAPEIVDDTRRREFLAAVEVLAVL